METNQPGETSLEVVETEKPIKVGNVQSIPKPGEVIAVNGVMYNCEVVAWLDRDDTETDWKNDNMQSTIVTIRRLATILLTVENDLSFDVAFREWQEHEGAFLPKRLRTRETFLKGIALQIERGEAPTVPGLIYKVERQELDVKI